MENDQAQNFLDEIGQLLIEDSDYPFEDTLPYVQIDHNMIGESIVKELGNQILYRRPVDKRFPYALLELWEARKDRTAGPRWNYFVEASSR